MPKTVLYLIKLTKLSNANYEILGGAFVLYLIKLTKLSNNVTYGGSGFVFYILSN